MTIYSTTTYQACIPELADKSIYNIACKQTDQVHLYDADKLFNNLRYDLELPSTIQVLIQNNLLMDGYDNMPDFDYFMADNNDFILHTELINPYPNDDPIVYLITAYNFDNEVGKAELVTHEAEYSPTHIHFSSDLQCSLNIVALLLSHLTCTAFLTIEKTTLENAEYQVNKRLNAQELLKPENKNCLAHAGDYWACYQLYTNADTENARYDYATCYTEVQARQAIKSIKEIHPCINPKTLVVQGCILAKQSYQEREYQKALIDIDKPYDFDKGDRPDKERATWIIESYQHSQALRQAIKHQQGGHA